MFGYLEGIPSNPELEAFVKKCKKIYTSHQRIGVIEASVRRFILHIRGLV